MNSTFKKMNEKELLPFVILHRMMSNHHDKELVNKLHESILKSGLKSKYHEAAWLMFETGGFDTNE